MAWTTPATAVTNTVITAAFWSTNIRDDENYLYNNEWLLVSNINNTDPINFTSIPTGFNNLKFVGIIRSTKAATQDDLNLTCNAITAYRYGVVDVDGAVTVAGNHSNSDTKVNVLNGICAANSPASTYSIIELLLGQYNNTTKYKVFHGTVTRRINTTANSDMHVTKILGEVQSNAAITSVKFATTAFNSNSYISMYGGY